MGNTVTSPPIYPVPDAVLPGVELRAATWDRACNLVNRAGRDQTGGIAISQSWHPGYCNHVGDVEKQMTPTGWPVPCISPDHARLTCFIEATSTGGGTVYLRSAIAADEVAFAVPDDPATQIIGPLDLDINDGAVGDVVTLHMVGADELATVIVLAVWAEPSTAAADAPAGDITPFGRDDATLSDRPLTAARGRHMNASLRAALDRARPMLSWAAIDADEGLPVPLPVRIPAHGVEGLARYHGRRREAACTVRLYTHADDLEGAQLAVDGAPLITLEEDDAPGWVTEPDRLEAREGALTFGAGSLSFRRVRLIDTRTRRPPLHTDVAVTSFAKWGP